MSSEPGSPKAPKPTSKACTACSAPLGPDELFCDRCGAPQKGAPSCPHCGAVTATSRHRELGRVCKVCGRPRVLVRRKNVELSGTERAPLERAGKARLRRAAWRAGGVLGGLGAAFVVGFTLLGSLLTGALGLALGLGLSLPFFLLALWAWKRSGAQTEQIREAIDAAWTSAARDIATQAAGPVTARTLTQALPVDEARAERLLAYLAVDDELRADISPEGRLSFAPALRIDASGDALAEEEAEREAAAEAEREATAEAALEEEALGEKRSK